jgi:hypothetical protein
VEADELIMRHLNYYADSKILPERQFVINVIGTLDPAYMEKLVTAQNRIRNVAEEHK